MDTARSAAICGSRPVTANSVSPMANAPRAIVRIASRTVSTVGRISNRFDRTWRTPQPASGGSAREESFPCGVLREAVDEVGAAHGPVGPCHARPAGLEVAVHLDQGRVAQ